MFWARPEAGDPAIGAPGTGGRGDITGFALEASNVDLENQFVQLIRAQRAYQAASRVVGTADEALTELVNLV
jgi:flagellar hook protein FlgE